MQKVIDQGRVSRYRMSRRKPALGLDPRVGSGSPIKDMRQRQNLQRFPVKTLDRANHYEREALVGAFA
jgi:hypothetical protein